MLQRLTDLGGEIRPVFAGGNLNAAATEPLIVTDGQPEDGGKVTGPVIDRLGYHSAVLDIVGIAHLADTKILQFAVGILESDDNSVWDAEAVLQAATTAYTGINTHLPTGFVQHIDMNLQSRKRYIQFTFTPTTNAGGDTASWMASLIMGGKESLPCP
jgi:hypothetical protein